MSPKLRFFDCSCSIGRTGAPILLDIPDAAGLEREMRQAGVEEALVYHTAARDAHPPLGNARLAEELRGHPALHPVWVLLPHHTGEMSRPAELRKELRAAGVKAVRLYPGRAHHSFSLAEWCCGELLAALEDAALPLLVDIEAVSWEDAAEILGRHPGLPLIAANCSYRHDRYIYPLLEKHPNLHVELSRFLGAGEIEDVVRRFGTRPLLFGTNMPVYTGTAAVARLTYADLEWSAKEEIAGGNLRRLLGGIRP
jgi:predicted TIM-barrel fold metal-dependent hydrolase